MPKSEQVCVYLNKHCLLILTRGEDFEKAASVFQPQFTQQEVVIKQQVQS